MQTILASLLTLVVVSLGCAGTRPADNRLAANKALARELMGAIERGDVAWLDAHYADDFEIWTAGSLPCSGHSRWARGRILTCTSSSLTRRAGSGASRARRA